MWTRRWSLMGTVLVIIGVALLPSAPASAAPPDPDRASCVEQFNLAVGTPGEYQRVFHQGALGRDVNFFARLPKVECPF